jgi:hypothetical protein
VISKLIFLSLKVAYSLAHMMTMMEPMDIPRIKDILTVHLDTVADVYLLVKRSREVSTEKYELIYKAQDRLKSLRVHDTDDTISSLIGVLALAPQ